VIDEEISLKHWWSDFGSGKNELNWEWDGWGMWHAWGEDKCTQDDDAKTWRNESIWKNLCV